MLRNFRKKPRLSKSDSGPEYVFRARAGYRTIYG
jgi:hypothetical protein